MTKLAAQVRGENEKATTFSKMIVRYKGKDAYICYLPIGTMLYLFNMTTGKISRNAFAIGKRENTAERLGEEYRRNMWYGDDNIEVIEKSDLEALLKARNLLRRVSH